MLDRLKKMIETLTHEDIGPEGKKVNDTRLAAAALLVHATLVDGEEAEVELAKLKELLQTRYDLSATEAAQLIALARKEENSAVDLYGFTRRLTRDLDREARIEMIEMLWEIAYSDGVVHEFEDNLISRVGELLHVEPRDRIRMRQKVKARLQIT